MDLKNKINEAKRSTKVALVGGAVVVAGSWGSCQFNYAEHSEPTSEEVDAPPAATPAEPFGESDKEENEADPAVVEG